MRDIPAEVESIGPASLPGPYLLRELEQAGYSGRQYCRNRQKSLPSERFPWSVLDCLEPQGWTPLPGSAVISLVPIWLAPALLPHLGRCRQFIAFGSTSRFSKSDSADAAERALAQRLAAAEDEIAAGCRHRGIPWTILRPTLVYDEGRDANISAIARFIERWGFFPVARPGSGLRQPVHAADLARAAVQALDNGNAFDRAFDLSGGETLTYRRMVERVFHGLGRPARVLPVPLLLPETLARIIPGFRRSAYSPALFRRMNQDLRFNADAAKAAFDYAPRPFSPTFATRGRRRPKA